MFLAVSSSVFYRCDKAHNQNQHEEDRVCFILQPRVHHTVKQGQEFKGGTWGRD